MSMLLCAAEGETASELQAALGHKQVGLKKSDIATIFEQQMSLLLQPNNSYTLTCANSLLSQKCFQVNDEYKKILTESFKAFVLEVDFLKENKKAVNKINEWVKEKTNNMIPELLQSLDPSAELILLNAVYFKGSWKTQFRKEATYAQVFYNRGLEEKAKETEMMHMTDSFLFFEEETFQAIQLPYISEEIAMIFLLPKERNGLDKLEAMLTSSFLEDLKQKFRKRKVKITLPRFRLEYAKSLVPYLSELGVKRAFSRGAELTVVSDDPDLAVSEIFHKAVLDVKEEGSEAAAATKIYIVKRCLEIVPEFVADHPFAFVIYNAKNDLILFMGRVYEL